MNDHYIEEFFERFLRERNVGKLSKLEKEVRLHYFINGWFAREEFAIKGVNTEKGKQ